MKRPREPRHWCQLCQGAGFVASNEEPTERTDPDGRTIRYRPPMMRCPRLGAGPVRKVIRRIEKGGLDRQRQASGEFDEEVG